MTFMQHFLQRPDVRQLLRPQHGQLFPGQTPTHAEHGAPTAAGLEKCRFRCVSVLDASAITWHTFSAFNFDYIKVYIFQNDVDTVAPSIDAALTGKP